MNLWNKIRVAYVEDQPSMRQSVSNFLNAYDNIKVVFDTDNGIELINYLKSTIPIPHVCILDITMPKMDGITLLEKIRSRWPKLPCLIYTMHHNESTIAKAIDLGANGYLSKRYGNHELHKALVDIMDTGIAFTEDADESLFHKVINRHIEVPVLTKRERAFLEWVGTDFTYEEIAVFMGVARSTVKGYSETCFKKLKVNTRGSLVLEAIRLGIINI